MIPDSICCLSAHDQTPMQSAPKMICHCIGYSARIVLPGGICTAIKQVVPMMRSGVAAAGNRKAGSLAQELARHLCRHSSPAYTGEPLRNPRLGCEAESTRSTQESDMHSMVSLVNSRPMTCGGGKFIRAICPPPAFRSPR